MADTKNSDYLRKIRLGMAACLIFGLGVQGARAGSQAETEFHEEGAMIRPATDSNWLAKRGTNFNPDAFSQNKPPAVPDSEVNLDAPLVGRAADMQMFLFLILAICGVGFLGLVVVSATQRGKTGGVRVRRTDSGGEEFPRELPERRHRRRRHSSHHADATPRAQM